MSILNHTVNELNFLAGGGEMGQLIRGKDWSKTSLGVPETWPQSLRTTLSILLHSGFPMVLFWGPELICFYNDAFRPSLGKDGKHPVILGAKGEEAWAEIWPMIKPWIDDVVDHGNSIWNEDLLVPIYRNGSIEDVYWTFSYSPVSDESGKRAGVFVAVVETTGKINTIKKLEDSERRFRTMAEASDILIAMSDETGNASYFNKAWMNLTGANMEALVGFGWTDFVHPDDKQPFLDIYLSAFASKQSFSGEFRVFNTKGEYRWLLAQGPPLFSTDGSFVGYISSAIDITDQKTTLKHVADSAQDLRSLVLQAPMGICVMDAPSRICEIVNESFVQIAGKSYEQIAGQFYWDAFAEARSYYEDALTSVVETGNTYFADEVKLMLIRHRKEELVYVTFVYAPLKDKEGRVKKVAVWVLENTQQVVARRKVEDIVKARTKELNDLNESLKRSEERYHLMVEEVQDYSILYLNSRGIVENWNLGAEKIKGYKAAEIIGKSFSNFYTEEDRKTGLPNILLEQARQTGRAVQQGWRVRKDGTLFWASVVITAVHNDKKDVIGFSKVTHDLTEKKKADDLLKLNAAELAQKNIELEKMNKELQAFAYVSSHDLQEPLRKIQTFSSQIIEKELDNLSEAGKNRFERLQVAAHRMQVLIDDLLSYSRAGTAEKKFERTSLLSIIEDVKEDLKEELLQKNATLEVVGMCDAYVIPFQFRQLLYNLLSNSLKFSDNTKSPHIIISTERIKGSELNYKNVDKESGYCHIGFCDNGIGFEQEYSEKIFEVFQRLHGKHKYEGTGIGLAIVKKIVENHDGIITVQSAPGKGTTFDIYIPAN